MIDVTQLDTELIWHPYTQHRLTSSFPEIVSAEGAYLTLANGTKVLDAISSWWVNLHGHAHPTIAKAIAHQSETLEHVIFGSFTHKPAVELAELLIMAARKRKTGLNRVFYSDNGSTAVETALKLAYQFHQNRGERSRDRFLALCNSYHGDTIGAMAVSERSGFALKFQNLLFSVDTIEADDIDRLDKALRDNPGRYAAMIVEPMIQGASGMKIYSADFLCQAWELCRSAGVLFICDEVFTGFYRTGTLFAFEHAGIAPDFVCLSKGLTGGFLPMGATLTTNAVFEAFLSNDRKNAFLHGHSYTANPLGCAAAIASWQLLHVPACQNRIKMISRTTSREIELLSGHPKVRSVRAFGTIGAVDIVGEEGYFASVGTKIRAMALEEGVLLRPLGNVLYAVPPYCVTEEEVRRIYQTMGKILERL